MNVMVFGYSVTMGPMCVLQLKFIEVKLGSALKNRAFLIVCYSVV